MRRAALLVALLLLLSQPSPVMAAGTITCQGGTCTGAMTSWSSLISQANTWSALQTFSAGLTVSGGNLIAPTLIGGTGTTSTLTLQPTSGVGASGADIIFKVGNNGATEAGRFLNDGSLKLGTTTGNALLELYKTGNSYMYRMRNSSVATSFYTDSSSGQFGTETPHSLIFYTNNINRAVISGSTGFLTLGATDDIAASLLDLRAGNLTFSGANGQKYVQGRKTELTPIAVAASTTTTFTIPANAILKSVAMRVTVQPPGTSTMVVTATTSGTVLQQGANMSTAAGTTDVGTRAYGTNYVGVAAQTITITPNVVPSDGTGRVRFEIYYDEPTAPTS